MIDAEDPSPPPAAPAQGTLWGKVKMSPMLSHTGHSKKEAMPWVLRPISFAAAPAEHGCSPSSKQKAVGRGPRRVPLRVPMQGSDSRGSLEDRACFASAAQGSGFVRLPPAPCCCWHADISKSAPAPLLSCGQTAPPGWADTALHGAHPSAGTALSLLPGTDADRGGKSSGAVGKQGRDRQTGMAVSL